MVALAFLLGCGRGCAGPADTGTSVADTAADTVAETAADTAAETAPPCDSDRPFDECDGRLGDAVDTRLLVEMTAWEMGGQKGLTVLRSQAELEAYWAEAGLAEEGAPLPTVDFTVEQVVAACTASWERSRGDRVEGFYRDAEDTTRLVIRVRRAIACETGDTWTPPTFQAWATPPGELERCLFGETCEDCF